MRCPVSFNVYLNLPNFKSTLDKGSRELESQRSVREEESSLKKVDVLVCDEIEITWALRNTTNNWIILATHKTQKWHLFCKVFTIFKDSIFAVNHHLNLNAFKVRAVGIPGLMSKQGDRVHCCSDHVLRHIWSSDRFFLKWMIAGINSIGRMVLRALSMLQENLCPFFPQRYKKKASEDASQNERNTCQQNSDRL